jgi:hypothetical protein
MPGTPKIGRAQHSAPTAATIDIIAIFSGGKVLISLSINIWLEF